MLRCYGVLGQTLTMSVANFALPTCASACKFTLMDAYNKELRSEEGRNLVCTWPRDRPARPTTADS